MSISLKVAKIQCRLYETHRIALTHAGALGDEVAERCSPKSRAGFWAAWRRAKSSGPFT